LNEPDEALISAVLVLLRAKGETVEEVSANFINFESNNFTKLLCCIDISDRRHVHT